MRIQVKALGFLFLGAAETVLGVTDAFKPVGGFRGPHARDASRIGARFAA